MPLPDLIFLFRSLRRACGEGGTLLWAEILYLIAEAQPAGVPAAQLAKKTGSVNQSVRHVLNYLTDHGLVARTSTRQAIPGGTAAYLYRLTDKAIRLIPAAPDAGNETAIAPDPDAPALFP